MIGSTKALFVKRPILQSEWWRQNQSFDDESIDIDLEIASQTAPEELGHYSHYKTKLGLSQYFNSLRPSDAYMRQKTRPSLVQIMACRLFGAKPLSEPTLEYY